MHESSQMKHLFVLVMVNALLKTNVIALMDSLETSVKKPLVLV